MKICAFALVAIFSFVTPAAHFVAQDSSPLPSIPKAVPVEQSPAGQQHRHAHKFHERSR